MVRARRRRSVDDAPGFDTRNLCRACARVDSRGRVYRRWLLRGGPSAYHALASVDRREPVRKDCYGRQNSIDHGRGAGHGTGDRQQVCCQWNSLHTRRQNRAKLRSVAAEITARGGSATVHALDVTDDGAVAQLGELLADTPVDMLINCAAIGELNIFKTPATPSLTIFCRRTCVRPYILSRTLLPNLRRSNNASIINIGSIVTSISVPTVSAYTAAKVGLKGLTGSLAAELRPEMIRVVMISPGPADTPMRDAASPGIDKTVLVSADTIAEMVYQVVTLPRGISTSDFVLYSMLWQ